MADAAELNKRIEAHKGWLTRRRVSCEKSWGFVRDNVANIPELEEAHSKYKEQVEKIEDLYHELQLLYGAKTEQFAAVNVRLDELARDSDAVITENLRVLANARQPPAAPQAAARQERAPANQDNVRQRDNESLKPFSLSKENTPEELRSWYDKYKAYYETSAMVNISASTQRQYLYSCLSSELESLVKAKVTEDTPIFATAAHPVSCMSIIREEFDQAYPLQLKRYDFFQCKQEPGEALSTFVTRLRQLGKEADLPNLTVDQTYVFRVLVACTDDKMRQELLKLDNPTLHQLEREITTHERVRKVASSMIKGQEGSARAASVSRDRGRSSSQSSKQSGKKRGPRFPPHLKGRCFRCGDRGHARDGCTKDKQTLHCNKCNSKGHVTDVCMKGWKPNASGGASRGTSRANSRAGSRAPSPSPSSSPARTKTVVARSCGGSKPTPRMNVTVRHGRKTFNFSATPDTGATKSIIAYNVVQKYQLQYVTTSQKLVAANQEPMAVVGCISLSVKAKGGQEVVVDALISPDLSNEMLVSWHDLIAMGVIRDDFPQVVAAVECAVVSAFSSAAVNSDNLDKVKLDFSDVLSDQLTTGKELAGGKMKIHLKKGSYVRPIHVTTAKAVPLHQQKAADELIDDLLAKGVIERVEHPTEWISPGFFVDKEGGKAGVRLVSSYVRLNEAIDRPVHPFPSTQDILQGLLPDSKVFAKLDAIHGYFQVPLDEDSADLTTFLLPSGKYRYLKAPMGLKSSNDEFCRRTDPVVRGLSYASKLVDDILIQAPDYETLYQRIRVVLERCRETGVTISLRKLKVGENVKFAGHLVTSSGVFPDPEKIKALESFPTPTNITALRGFIGLANQLANFVPDLSHMMTKMRELLKKDVQFTWLPDHEKEFQSVKRLLTSDMLVKSFDPSLPTELLTDASKLYGLGYMLLQRDETGNARVIKCGSCALDKAQKNYAPIELECLAIYWAITKCSFYLKGMNHFTVVTDHKPLVGYFKKNLDQIANEKLLRYITKLLGYNFHLEWRAGKVHQIADALSRAPVFSPWTDHAEGTHQASFVKLDERWKDILSASLRDSSYKDVLCAVRQGADVKKLPCSHPARAYRNVWERISVDEESNLLVLDSNRVIVPPTARRLILQKLHLPHQGQTKTKKLAQQNYYWPGMTSDIKNVIDSCESCQELRPSKQKEPIAETTEANFPMEHVAADLFDLSGKQYLVLVCRFSGFPFVKLMRGSVTTSSVTSALSAWFNEWGWPASIRTDGGPQFRKSFTEFCEEHSVLHETSSPHNPRSNGLAESAVKNMKFLLKKTIERKEDFEAALLEWRNVPREDGVSPAQLFLGRRQRTQLPQVDLYTDSDVVELAVSRKEALERKRAAHDVNALLSKPLKVGQLVRLKDPLSGKWDDEGVVKKVHKSGKSYDVDTLTKGTVWRSIQFLRPLGISPSSASQQNLELDTTTLESRPTYADAVRRSARLKAKRVHFSPC